MPAKGKKYFQIASLEKGVKILELLAVHEELTVSKVAELMDLNRAGSHRFLATLRELGWVEKNEQGRYQLTFRILELGMAVANRFEIRQVARPFMQTLSTASRETVRRSWWRRFADCAALKAVLSRSWASDGSNSTPGTAGTET